MVNRKINRLIPEVDKTGYTCFNSISSFALCFNFRSKKLDCPKTRLTIEKSRIYLDVNTCPRCKTSTTSHYYYKEQKIRYKYQYCKQCNILIRTDIIITSNDNSKSYSF